MRQHSALLLLIWLFEAPAAHADIPLPELVVEVGTERELAVFIGDFPYPSELTPLVLTETSGRHLFVLATSATWLCATDEEILDSSPGDRLVVPYDDCMLVTQPEILESIEADGAFVYRRPEDVGSAHWRRTYDGVFGLHVHDDRLVAIRHGEHANTSIGGYDYQGLVFPDVDVADCWSGYQDGVWSQCWVSFASFANFAWAPYSSQDGWAQEPWVDEGPVVWPEASYRTADGSPTGGGYYHTTSFVLDGFLHLFSVVPRAGGGAQCTTAARAALSDDAQPGTWRNWHAGAFDTPSLPDGFDRDELDRFWEVGGGASDCLFDDADADAALWLAVARIQGTPYFLGAEESSPDYQHWQMGLRVSNDLVHWSPLRVLSSSIHPWGVDQRYSYPTLIDAEGRATNEVVDAGGFVVLGKAANVDMGYALNAMDVSLSCEDAAIPVGVTPTGEVEAGRVTVSWAPDATAAFYSIRIDDRIDGSSDDCDQASPADVCLDQLLATEVAFDAVPGHVYDLQVRAWNLCARPSGSAAVRIDARGPGPDGDGGPQVGGDAGADDDAGAGAGADAGIGLDAGVGADGGAGPDDDEESQEGGCGCVAARGASGLRFAPLLLGLLWRLRRRG